jgi:hypothetical protein
MGKAQYLHQVILTSYLSFGETSSGLQPNASKKLVSGPIKSVASTHAFGESHPGSDRYFDLRLAPDYAE